MTNTSNTSNPSNLSNVPSTPNTSNTLNTFNTSSTSNTSDTSNLSNLSNASNTLNTLTYQTCQTHQTQQAHQTRQAQQAHQTHQIHQTHYWSGRKYFMLDNGNSSWFSFLREKSIILFTVEFRFVPIFCNSWWYFSQFWRFFHYPRVLNSSSPTILYLVWSFFCLPETAYLPTPLLCVLYFVASIRHINYQESQHQSHQWHQKSQRISLSKVNSTQ